MRLFLAAMLLCVCAAVPASAQSSGKENLGAARIGSRIDMGRHGAISYSVTRRDGGQIVSHPQGCPRRAFCGCGAALKVYGRHVRSLWLARAWFQFPRTSPAPGMVAVRRNHVFVIKEVRAGNIVLAYDANSGGRKTRIHERSLRGFVVVNPHARRVAGI